MSCEVCGRQIIRTPYRVIIEGAKMLTCAQCAELGSTPWRVTSKISSSSAKKRPRTIVKSVSIEKKNSIRVPEDLVIAENFRSIVRESREMLGLSHEDLGKKIREKVSVIKKVESGRMLPDHRLAAKLESALGIRLLVPLVVPEIAFPSSPSNKGVTLGDIVHFEERKKEDSRERKQS